MIKLLQAHEWRTSKWTTRTVFNSCWSQGSGAAYHCTSTEPSTDLPFLALSQAILRALEETNGVFYLFLVGKNKNRNHWHQHPVFCKMPEAHCTNKLSIFIFLMLFLEHLGSARCLFQRLDSPELELRFITMGWLATDVEDNRPVGKAPPLLRWHCSKSSSK